MIRGDEEITPEPHKRNNWTMVLQDFGIGPCDLAISWNQYQSIEGDFKVAQYLVMEDNS